MQLPPPTFGLAATNKSAVESAMLELCYSKQGNYLPLQKQKTRPTIEA